MSLNGISYTPIQPFRIQIGRPRLNSISEKQHEFLFEAMNALFPEDNESAILIWNDIPLQMFYHSDVDVILAEWAPVLNELCDGQLNEPRKLSFTIDYFNCDLTCSPVDPDKIELQAIWKPLREINTHHSLNLNKLLVISITDLVAEWRTLVRQVIEILTKNQITLIDPNQKKLLESLNKISSHSDLLGIYYR